MRLGRQGRARAALLLAVALCGLLRPVTTQTTDALGFPDPRYSSTQELTAFSCTGGARNCPDGGQYAAAGGNLTLTVVEMKHLPDLDGFGLAGRETDAYVEASIGDNVRTSGVVWNSLNPRWAPCVEPGCTAAGDVVRDLHFGFRPAGTEITLRVLDRDSGLEFGDDLVAQVTLHAIYCSAFSALEQRVPTADASSWAMPRQPLCVEELWLPLSATGGGCSDDESTTPCLRLRMTAVPFQMRTEDVFVSGAAVLGGMGGYFPDEPSWLYGRVYAASDTQLLSYYRMDAAQGGLLVRPDSASANHRGNTSLEAAYGFAPYARVTLNFAAQLFVFRREPDASNPEPRPAWLGDSAGWTLTREYAQLAGVPDDFRAVARNVSAHAVNAYGDAGRAGVVLGANVPANATDSLPSMYFVVAVPHETRDVVKAVYSKALDSARLLHVSLQFVPSLAFLLALALRYLRRMHWRLDRVQSFLAHKVSTPERDIVAQLLSCPGDGAQFRRRLFYACGAVRLALAAPVLLLLAWGVTCIVLVTPPALGFGLVFLGTAALAGGYGAAAWARTGWRMTAHTLRLLALAFLAALAFLLSATFADPRVFVGGQDLDFLSLSAVCLTLNMLPLLWLAFTNDAKLAKSLAQVLAVVAAAKKATTLKSKFRNLGTLGLKLAAAKGEAQAEAEASSTASTRTRSAFAALLGDHYTVEQSLPGLEHADILQSAFVTPAGARRRANRRCYACALATLALYCVMAAARTAFAAQAVGTALTLALVDLCVYMLHRGPHASAWSAGYVVLLLSSVRVSLAATCGRYWILGHALLYMLLGSALCRDIVGKNLPRMNKQEAGGVTFFGHDPPRARSNRQQLDVGTTPEFVLGVLSFFYVFLLLAVAFGADASESLRVPVLGQAWPLWVFGVLAFLVVLFLGLALATSRALFLQREQLLSDYAMHVYLFVRPLRLPFMLAAASEVLVICAGLFIYAATHSSFLLVTSVFAPLVLMLALAVFVQWRKNDFRLVVWPPEDDEEDALDDDDDGGFGAEDAAAALEQQAELLRETFVLPPLKGKGSMSVYDSADESFKMPALPPKALLGLSSSSRSSSSTAAAAASAKPPLALPGRATAAALAKQSSGSAKGDVDALARVGTGLTVVPEGTDGHVHAAKALGVTPTKKPRFAWLRGLWARTRRAAGGTKYSEVQHVGAATAQRGGDSSAQDDAAEKPLLGRRRSRGVGDAAVDFGHMTLYEAYRQGFLLPQDHVTLGCFAALLLLLWLYGMVLSATETPAWLGQLVWTGAYVLVFTLFPTLKYFKTATWTGDMTLCLGGSAALAWLTGAVLFFHVLRADVNQVESLVVLSVLVLYPAFVLAGVTLWRWQDAGWVLTRELRRVGGLCLGVATLWIAEMFVFVGPALGGVLSFLLLLFLFVAYFVVKWVANDRYLAPRYERQARALVAGCTAAALVAALASGAGVFYCLSIVFVVLLLQSSLRFAAGWVVAKRSADDAVFYSPYLFPVFSYNAFSNNVVDETPRVLPLYTALLLAFLWGVSGVMLVDPLGFGVGLCSLVLLAGAGVTAHLCAVTPVHMGLAAKYVNDMILRDASDAAQHVADRRRQPFTLESPEFVELERREKKAELEFQAIAYGGGAAKAFSSHKKAAKTPASSPDDEPPPEPRRTAGDLALAIHEAERQCRFVTAKHGRDVPRADGLLTWREAYDDVFRRAVGPFGFLYALTLPWRLLRFVQWKYWPSTLQRRKSEAQAETGASDDCTDQLERGGGGGGGDGNGGGASTLAPADAEPATPPRDLVELLVALPTLDAALDRAFYEETRCVIHLQLLMLTASDARLSREKVRFQQFLRENRFKLLSNGLSPPANVFRTSSFASIDIPLVAVWLLSLSPDARARFHALKAAFNDEMERVDAVVDAEDRAARAAQQELRDFWAPREAEQCRRRVQEFQARRLRREAEGVLVEEEERTPGYDEALVNAQEALLEIESGYSCTPGACGRALQFVDREFPADATSLAGCAREAEVAPQWQVSTAINVAAGLFDGGTDPDDVRVGRLQDAWLLSALSILAASGGLDDGKVDPLIDKLFVTKQTSLTGAYALRLFQNCQWETVLVDDFFPVLYDSAERAQEAHEAHEADEVADVAATSAGAAFAHSRDFEELWVPLVEKAFAKYYGGYAALERGGYVHHALRVLSGCECDEVFLAPAARGALKKTLWQQLQLFRANRFLLGAASLPSEHADPALRASGLVFDACYVVYDVRDVDGVQLLQLRNPPGDHPEWKGDWSDSSRLWTRRLRKRLHVAAGCDAREDNTFWMSFDDFCHAFRALYVCRYYDPVKWRELSTHASFSRQDSTASGLPTRHNPSCTGLDNNPQFALRVARPTDVIVTVTQVDARGVAPVEVLPLAVYIVAQGTHKDRARRVTTLSQENVAAHSGAPTRSREVRVQCELQARTYTLLVAAYKSGMEGPFRVHVRSNYPVELETIWPAVWKTGGGGGGALGARAGTSGLTLAERMADKVKHTVADSAAGAKLLAKGHELVDKLAAGAAIVDSAMRDEETILKEQLAQQQQDEKDEKERQETRLTGKKKKRRQPEDGEAAAPQHAWVEQWDEDAGKPFYFNKQTGLASWEKPDGL